MSNITVNIKRLDPTVELPKYAHPTDAGLDLRANEDCTLKPFERRLVSTGLAIALPDGYAGFVQPRSGLAIKQGLSIVNTPGLIDAHYRGELKVILINLDHQQYPDQQRRPHRPARHPRSPHSQSRRGRRTRQNRPRSRRFRLQWRRLVVHVLSADRLDLPIYHPMLKHSRFAGAHGSRFRLSPTHIIPCSNILASLRNCARDDMCGVQAKGLHA